MAKYASITFSQFGLELPTSGMNEAGLIVQMLWDEDNLIPDQPDDVAALNELQFVQFLLDNYASLNEVKQAIAGLRFRKSYADLHYVVCDKNQCALLEFDNEKLMFISEQFAPYVITNKSLENSKRFYKSLKASPKAISDKKEALPAYARAVREYELLNDNKHFNQENLLQSLTHLKANYEFMDIYNWIIKSKPPSVTAWSAVYDSKNLKVYWRNKDNPKTKIIDFAELTRSCSKPYLALTLNQEYSEDNVTSEFSPRHVYTENARIIRASYEPIEEQFPKAMQDVLIHYSKQFSCSVHGNSNLHDR